jgi:hypothetical protein
MFMTPEELKTAQATADGINFDTTGDTSAGFEQMHAGTMAIPFIRILQQLSPQLNKDDPAYIAGAEVGDYFNTITKEIIKGKEGFDCVVLKFENIFLEWKPNRGGFAGRHTVENAERLAAKSNTIGDFGKWKTPEGNNLQENYVYLILMAGHEADGLMVMSMASSMLKFARDWNRLMTSHVMGNGQKAMPYYLVWHMTTEYKKNEKGAWYVPAVSFSRYINADQHKLAQEERKLLPTRQVDYAQIEAKGEGAEETAF